MIPFNYFKLGTIAALCCSLSACQPTGSFSSLLSETGNFSSNPPPQGEWVASTATPALEVASVATSSYPRRPFTLTDGVKPGSSFGRFRSRLQQAVRSRDAKFIRAIADPNIHLSFGRSITLDRLKIDDPNSLFWNRLERIINTGCAAYEAPPGKSDSPPSFACPHVFQASLGDPFTDVYIVGTGVNARARPRADSPVIAVLSNEVVKSDPQGFSALSEQQKLKVQTWDGWQPVIVPNGQRGYVSSRYAYVPAGYRALFENKGGSWKMTAFIAGD